MKVTLKGQVTIPLKFRKFLGISPGSEIEFVTDNGKVYIQKVESHDKFEQVRGILEGKFTTDEIMSMTRDY